MRKRDVRDHQTETVSRLIDAALDDASKREQIARTLLPDDAAPKLPEWPPPSRQANALALLAVRDAIPCIRRAAATHELDRLPSQSMYAPEPHLRLPPTKQPEHIVYRAPLVVTCLDGDANYELAHLLVYRFSPQLWKPEPGEDSLTGLFAAHDVRTSLMRRLNGYLLLEANLWWLAREGGFPEPVPYSVRYESARWLWSPDIAGTVFCLRCGQDIAYRRKERTDRRRRARCASCSRGTNVADWPDHAIAPHDRGRWWLRCRRQGCPNVFIDDRSTLYCHRHRLARTTPSRRRTS